jgi:tetratricopeptide (TPR) repeat protein
MFQRPLRITLATLALAFAAGWSPSFCQAAKPREKESKTDKTKAADAAYKRAQAAFENSEFDEAIGLFGEVLKIDAGYVEAYVSRGMAWNEKSDPDKAIKDFNDAIRVDPKFAPAFFNRGMSWNAKSEYDRAIKDFGAALALDPRDDAALFNRGVAWSKKGDVDAAIKDYDASIKLDDSFAPAYVFRGEARAAKKEYDKAIQDYEEAIRLDPKDGTGLNGKAWVLATCPEKKYRDGKKAVELATMACEQTKYKEADFLDTLSCAHAEAGKFDEAVKWQKKALADPNFVKELGQNATAKLKLFEQKKPYRDDGR